MPPPADPPTTPPRTPDFGNGKSWQGGGQPSVTQGNVKFEGTTNHGVQTGNIFGYNLIIGRINVALDSANDLTHKIQEFASRIEMVSLRLRSVGEKVGATANVINTISDLVVKQARRENIGEKQVTKEARMDHVEKRDWGLGKGKEPESEVLGRRCFKNLMGAIEGANRLFDNIIKKIEDASDTLLRPQVLSRGGRQPGQVERVTLDEADRERVFLTEKDIGYMEMDIESRKTELNMMFFVFEFVVNDGLNEKAEENRKIVKQMMADSWRILKDLATRLLHGGGGGPQPRPDPWVPGVHPPRPGPLPDMRPLDFPDLSRLTSLYMAWVIRKGPVPGIPAVGLERAHEHSWASAVITRLALSTEELFLKVLAQTSQRARLGWTLQDECAAVLKTTSQKLVVNRLLRDQNQNLQRLYPQLEWTLGGLESLPSNLPRPGLKSGGKRKEKGKKKKQRRVAPEDGNGETTSIEIILKSQWRPPGPWLPPPHGPGGLNGPVPVPGPLDPGQDPTIIPPGASAKANKKGTPQRRRDSKQEPARSSSNSPGRSFFCIQLSSRPKERKPGPVLREPKFVFVKEGGKKKAEKAGKAKSQKKHREQVYIELRRPGSYRRRSSSSENGSSEICHDDIFPGRPQPPLPPPPLFGFGRQPAVIQSQMPRPAKMPHPPVVQSQMPRPPQMPRPGKMPHPPFRPQPPVGHSQQQQAKMQSKPPPPARTHVDMLQKERESREETRVVEELFEDFEELHDRKGKKKSRRPSRVTELEGIGIIPSPAVKFSLDSESEPDSDSYSDITTSRKLMRQVEKESQKRMNQEQELIEKMKRLPTPVPPIRIQTRRSTSESEPYIHMPPAPRVRERRSDRASTLHVAGRESRDRHRDEARDHRVHQVQVEDVAEYDDDDGEGEGREYTQE